jgi:GMP synthase-like glutamine amidotransferase
MRIGIIETGGPPGELRERFGGYADMLQRLLGERFDYVVYDAQQGPLPDPEAGELAYLLTGSPAGVYDGSDWIAALAHFLRSVKGKAKLVGICFGHQIMAEAFGGKVEKSDKGWGIGLHRHNVLAEAAWMAPALRSIAIPVSHQDQIVVQPPATRILASSSFSPFAMLGYEDQPAISCQFHPEFEPGFARALIEARRERLPDADAAIASLDAPDDRLSVADWIARFLET